MACTARAACPPDDPLLIHWVKEPSPFIALPPHNDELLGPEAGGAGSSSDPQPAAADGSRSEPSKLTGWRDPFVVERPCEANNWEWVMLIGSGAPS